MFEVDEASRLITESCDPQANIIFGTSIDEKYTGEIKVTVIATGFSEETNAQLAGMNRGGFAQSGIFGKNGGQNIQSHQTQTFGNNPFGNNNVNRGSTTQTSLPHTPPPAPENDFDVPAFLRNKMPK